ILGNNLNFRKRFRNEYPEKYQYQQILNKENKDFLISKSAFSKAFKESIKL
ncbi:34090_t:CDS:1, partial [Gigaspora margarita]